MNVLNKFHGNMPVKLWDFVIKVDIWPKGSMTKKVMECQKSSSGKHECAQWFHSNQPDLVLIVALRTSNQISHVLVASKVAHVCLNVHQDEMVHQRKKNYTLQ